MTKSDVLEKISENVFKKQNKEKISEIKEESIAEAKQLNHLWLCYFAVMPNCC